jgi:hypothetical protein
MRQKRRCLVTTEKTKKRSLIKAGLVVFLCGWLFNVPLVMLGVGGIVRECARLSILVGFGMIVVGVAAKYISSISCLCKKGDFHK